VRILNNSWIFSQPDVPKWFDNKPGAQLETKEAAEVGGEVGVGVVEAVAQAEGLQACEDEEKNGEPQGQRVQYRLNNALPTLNRQ
jgi:hypothetical protein